MIYMNSKTYYINEDGSMNFEKFELFTESEQHAEMQQWTVEQWMQY